MTGSIKFTEVGKSIDILRLRDEEIRDIRGRKISMVFQEPMTSLHPMYKIGDQLRGNQVHSNLAGDEITNYL